MVSERNWDKGMIHVYTGTGKGKTTAALGCALRAVGHNMRVCVIQFMKGNIDYGELESARRLDPNLVIHQMGRETFVSKDNPDPVDREWAEKGFKLAAETVMSGNYDVVVLDEICCALDFSLISLGEVLDLIRQKPASLELILTGRGAPGEIIEAADLVTEMKEVKHYYRQGITSRIGIEL